MSARNTYWCMKVFRVSLKQEKKWCVRYGLSLILETPLTIAKLQMFSKPTKRRKKIINNIFRRKSSAK